MSRVDRINENEFDKILLSLNKGRKNELNNNKQNICGNNDEDNNDIIDKILKDYQIEKKLESNELYNMDSKKLKKKMKNIKYDKKNIVKYINIKLNLI